MKKSKSKIHINLILYAGCAVLFVLTCLVVKKHMGIAGADVTRHVDWALTLPYFDELLPFIPYPLFHTAVRALVRITSMGRVWATAIVLGALNAATLLLVYELLKKEVKSKLGKYLCAVFACLMLQAIYVPAFNERLYIGQGSINIWHNPTYMIVRPFGLLAILILIQLLRLVQEKKKPVFTGWWWALLVVMIFCNLAKPSFSQVFIPGLGLYMLVDIFRTRGANFMKHVQIACAFIPATILLFIQAASSLGSEVYLSWMEVWNSYTRNPYVSLVLLMAFPIYVILGDVKGFFRKNENLVVSFVYLAGFLEAALLTENNARKFSGNFFWGYYQSAFLLWVLAAQSFVKRIAATKWSSKSSGEKAYLLIGLGIFLLHLLAGIYYLYCHIVVPGFWY